MEKKKFYSIMVIVAKVLYLSCVPSVASDMVERHSKWQKEAY